MTQITKQKAVELDLLFGKDTTSQTRNNTLYAGLNKVRLNKPVDNVNQLNTIDPIQFPELTILAIDPAGDDAGGIFEYDASIPGTSHNGSTIIAPSIPFIDPAQYAAASTPVTGCYVRVLKVFSDDIYDMLLFGIPIGDILRTAAFLDVMTDLSDPNSGGVMPPGAFGLGAIAIQLTSSDDLDSLPQETKLYYWASDAPANAPDLFCTCLVIADAGGQSQKVWQRNANGTEYFRANSGGSFGTWKENWHTGNLNTTKFGVDAPFQVPIKGIATSATNLRLELPVNYFNTPSSVAFTSTFTVRSWSGAMSFGSVSGGLQSALSSNRIVFVDVTASGLTPDVTYRLDADTNSSEIEVIP